MALAIAVAAVSLIALAPPPIAAQGVYEVITVEPSTNVEVQEGEDSKLILNLSRPVGGNGFVTVQTIDGTAQSPSDYGDVSLSHSREDHDDQLDLFLHRSGTIEVPVVWDYDVEGSETFQVKLEVVMLDSDPQNVLNLRFPDADNSGTLDTSLTIDVTITERDKFEVSFRPGGSVTEGENDDQVFGTQLRFELYTDKLASGTVQYQTKSDLGTARSGHDYEAISGTIRINAHTEYQRTKHVSFKITDDSLVENSETVFLELFNPTGNLVFPDLDGDGEPDERIQAIGIIKDDEAPLWAEAPDVSVTEGGGARITLTLERALLAGESVQFYVNVAGHQFGSQRACGIGADDYAQPNLDYQTAERTEYMIGEGEQSITFAVPTASDPLHENDECLYARLFAISGLQFRTQASQVIQAGNRILFTKVTIEDDDPKPHLIFGSPEVMEPDPDLNDTDPTATLRYPVSLSNPSGVETTVDYGDGGDGDATGGVDYKAISPGTLTFRPGEVRRYVDVEVKADWLEEPDEQVYLEFSNAVEACLVPGDACQPPSGSVTVPGTILNDDRNLKITLTPDDDRVREGEPINFRARLSHPIDYELRITSEWGGGTATEGDDYFRDVFAVYPELKIFPGTTEAVSTVATLKDSVAGEGVESLTLPNLKVALWRKSGASWAPAHECAEVFGTRCDPSNVPHRIPTPTAYILDGPVLGVTAERKDVAEGNTAHVTVALSEPTAQGVTFTIQTVDGAGDATGAALAEAGADYTRLSSQTVTIRPGETDGGTYTVATLQDQVDEPDHMFTVQLHSNSGALLDEGIAVVTIRDDDPRPNLSIADARANEGDALSFALTLSRASERTITVRYVTEDDTATTGLDYQGIEHFESVIFAPGEVSKTITVHSLMDNIPEIDETFRVELVDDPGVRLVDATAVGTIEDDDGVVISIADAAPIAETEGATPSATFTITMAPQQATAVTVQWQTMDGRGAEHYVAKGGGQTLAGEKDYTAVSSGTVTFAPGETVKRISTTVLDDSVAETDENFRVVISVSDPNITVLRSTAFATIEDDDAWNIWLDENNAAWVEEGTGPRPKRLTLNVRRTDASAEETPQDARFHSRHSYITCFISEVKNQWPLTRIPNPYEYVSTATVAASGWDVRKYYSDNSQLEYPQCHKRGDGSSFNVDTFEKLSYTLPLEFEIRGDSIAEENETFTLLLESSLFGPGALRFDPVSRGFQYITVTIVDDDTPQASITGATVNEDAGSAELTMSLSMAPTEQQSVRVSMEAGTAQPWEDYQPLLRHDVTFEPGETTKTFSIPIVNDHVREGDETFTVVLSGESAGINIHPGGETATVTIQDDESDYLPWLTVPDRVIDEGDAATLLFRLNPPVPNRFWVGRIQWSDDDKPMSLPVAAEIDDYAEITGNTADAVRVGLEQTEFTKTISSVEDTLIEAGEYIGISTTWMNAVGNPIRYAKPNALVAIRDDDHGSVAVASISAATVEENEEWAHDADLTGASNPLGDVSWSVDGDDAAFFTIDQDSGVLTMSARNFEDPLDDDGDNVYEVTVHAVDEDGNADSEDVRVTVTDVTYATFTVQPDFCCHADLSKQVYGAEEGDGIRVSVYPRFDTSTPVSLKWATAEDTKGSNPAAATDYTPSTTPTKLSWRAGGTGTTGTSQTFTIATTEDALVEPNETFLLRFTEGMAGETDDVAFTFASAPDGAVRTDHNEAEATLTIGNDDEPELTIGDASIAEGGTAEFTVTLSAVSGRDVTVQWTTGDDPAEGAKQATADTDYTAVTTARTATIAAGSTTATIEVQTTGDVLAEGDETFVVTLASPTNAGLGSPSRATGTITDDDAAATTATLGVSPASVAEGAGATTVTVTATLGGTTTFTADKTVSVTVGRDGDAAVSGTDYTKVDAFDITIAAGRSSGSKTFTLTPTQDALDETDETLTVHATAAGLTISDASVAISDDDATPTLTIGAASVAEGGTAEFTVTLSAVSGRDVTVQWTTGDDPAEGAKQATADTDYTAVTTARTATIAAGSTTATIEVQTTGDVLAEGDETFVVTLASPTNAGLGSPSRATGTITDDDAAATTATLGVSPASVAEGAGATTVTVTATLGGTTTFTADKTVSVTVGRDGDAAVSGTDYTKVDAFDITIAAGRSSGSKTFTLTPTQDALDETDETLTVHATAAGLTISDASVAISDDDATPTLTIGAASVAEGGTAEFTVTLSAVSGRDVTVQWTTGDDPAEGAKQATADTDYTAVTTARTATIAAGSTTATIEVQTTGDVLAEGDETFVVTLASPTNAGLGSPSRATGTITDDDAAATTATLGVSPASVAEGAGATTVTVTATLGGTTTFTADKTVSVTVGRDGDAAVSGTDYTKVDAFDITIAAGRSSGSKTFTLTPTQDALDETDETLTVHATAAGLTISDASVAISDDDATPTLTIGAASVAEGGTAEFTVTLSAVSGRDVTVQWTTGDDPAEGAKQATADTDYTAVTTARTATIAAGSTTATIEVQTTGDVLAEGDETFVVTLASPTNAGLGSPSRATGTITDDDAAATTATLGVSPASVAEGAGATTVTVTATLGGTTTFTADKTVSVTVGRDGDAAVSGTDYTKVDAFDITIAAGRSSGSKTFTLTPTQDALDETDETLTVHATAAGLTISDASVAISDDDATPTLTIGAASVAEGGTAEFTVTLSAVSGRDVTVQWTTGDDPAEGAKQATADTDYTAVTTARTATIAAGSTTATIEVQTTGDVLAEGDETFVVTLASPTNAGLGSPSRATGTITDDDAAATTATLGVSPASVAEGAGATTVTVTATLGGTTTFTADKTVSVTVGRDGDAAVSGTDYTKVDAFDITIAAGRSSGSKTFTLTPTQDALDETDETLTVHATAAGLTISDASVAISDDDATPTLTIGAASVAEGGTAEFTVTLSAVSGRDVTVQWTTGDDPAEGAKQATADTDYTAVTTARTATIAAGSTTATIEVQTTGDVLAEGDETFVVTLASPTNAGLGSPSRATGTITDDDAAATTATLGVSPASVAEGAGATTVTVTATLGGTTTFTADKTVSVTVGRDGDAAVSGTDYTKVDAFDITIAAGRSSGSKTFTLTPTQDALDETDETLTVHATAAGLTISDASVAISDDDATPTLTIGAASVAEGGTAEFTVTLSAVSGRDVTVQWTTGDDPAEGAKQATADTDYTAVTTARTATIAAGSTTATIEVQTTGDVLAEGDETFVVTLASPTNAGLGSPSRATGTITDDDAAATTATLGVSPASVAEGAGATTVTVTATLGGTTTFTADKTVSVTVGRDGDAAVSGTDYTKVDAFDITIAAGRSSGSKTFTLTPTQDALDETDETLTVHATAAGLTISDASVAISDDDATPTLTIGAASVAEGGTAEFTVTLSAVSGRDVTVQWTTGDDPAEGAKQATADTDYTAVTTARTATIAAGSTTATIEVQTTGDVLAEGDETFVVTLASPTNAGLGSPSRATGTITDDDAAATTATLGVSPASVAEGAGATTVTVTATLGGTTTFTADKTVSVTVGRDGDAAVSGTDYTKVDAFDITIAAGRSSGSKTFTLTPTQDALDETDETLTVHATAAGLTISDASVAISDDDATPTLTIGAASVAEGGTAEFTVTLSAVSGRDVTVQWTTGDDPAEGAKQATADTDYTAVTTARTATIAAGSTTATIEVQTTGDVLAEGDETFVVTLASPTNAGLGSPSRATGTITDDDAAATTATLGVSPASVAEGAGATTVTVTATLGGTTTFTADKTVSVTVGRDGDAAVSGTDYTKVDAFDITIAAGRSSGSKTFTLTPTQDALDETDETLTVHATAAGLTISDASVAISDDDATPTLTIGAASVAEGGTAEFTVTLSAVSGRDVTVQWTTGDDPAEGAKQATADTDYTAVTTARTATIAAGSTTATIEVQTTGDVLAEGDETFVVTLASPTNAGLGSPSRATGTITDDDAAATTATLGVSPASVAEGAGATTVTVTATLGGTTTFTADKTVSVTVGRDGDAAVSGTDYTKVDAFDITIAAGRSSGSKTFTLTPTQDALDETDETLTVHATAAGLTISDASVAISDDDATPTLTIGAASVAEGGTAEFTVTLSAVSGRDVTVQWTTGDDPAEGAKQATADTDYTAVTTARTATIAAGSTTATIEVQTTGDVLAEGDETFVVTLASPTNAGLGSPSRATGTITDDDAAATTATLGVSPASVAEGAGATTVTVTATLGGTTTFTADKTVSVTVGRDGDAAVSGTDYTKVDAFDITIAAGRSSGSKTFTLTPTQDALDETDETLTVHATAAGLTISDASVAISDDDATPTLTIGAASVAEGGTAEFTVTLSAVSGRDVTVQWTTGDDPAEGAKQATADTDYTAVTTARTATIAAGSTTATIEVQTTGDVLAEGDETFVVTLASPTNAGLGSPSRATGTITDDDAAATTATLGVSPASVAEGAGATTVTVTATLGGTTTFTADKTVSVTVGRDGDAAVSGTDYTKVDAFDITIAAGRSSGSKTFTLTPTQDALDETDETLTVHATAAGLTISDASVAISDDDATPLPALWIGAGAFGEGGKVYLLIELSAVSTQAVTVEWQTADDTSVGAHRAIAGTDYTAVTPARTAIIPAGATSVWVTVQTIQDSLVEEKETFLVMLQNPTNATLGNAIGKGTIYDDDGTPPPAVSVGDATVAEGGKAQFTITLSAVSTQAVTVEWRTADDTSVGAHQAIAGTDYTAVTSARTATIAAGATSATVEVQTTQDSLDEENETFLVTLQNPANATLGNVTGTATITDDDASPQVSVSDAASVLEGNNPAVTTDMTFTVSLSRVTSKQVTVPFTLGGTAAEGSDYTAPASLAVTVPPMTTGANIVVAVTGDTVKEDDETIVVTLGTPTNATLSTAVGAGTGTGIIKDDEAEKQIDVDVTLRLSPPIIPENGGSKGASYVTATLSEPLPEDVTLQLDATAVAPAGAGEFVLSQNRRLVIKAGATESAGIVTVTAVDDDIVTSDKIIEISAVVVHPARLQAPDSAELTIINDDLPVTPLATVGYERSAYTLGEDGRIDIGVVMSAAQASEVVVRYNLHAPSPILGGSSDVIAKGDGLAGADYAGEIVFAAGETRRVLKLYGVDNDIVEADEEVTLGLWVHTGDVKAGAPATVTLTDDDRSHLFFARTTSAVKEGGQQSITVRMNKAHQDPVSVALGVGGKATAGADYTALPQSVTFSPGTENQYLIVDTLTDGITEGTETLEITLGAVTGFGVLVLPSAGIHQLEIADSRGAPKPTRARLSVTPGAVDEDAGSTNVMVSATLVGTATFPQDMSVSVNVGKPGDQAEAGTDYAVVNGFTITIPAGQASGQQSFMLTPTDDAAAEQHEALTVHGTAAGLSVADATVTITDDDGTAPTTARLIVNPAAVAEDAGATQVTVTATLVGSGTLPQSTTVSVNVGSQGDGAVSGTDYAAVSGFAITIPAGQASGQHTFTLMPTDDAVDEPNEALTVHGTAAGLSVADATVTITDNDSDPQASATVSFAQAAYTLNEDARLRIDVVMSAVQTSEVVVRYTLHAASTTLGGSADVRVLGDRRAGAGYDGEVVFAAGETRQVLHLSSVDNDIVEPDEEVTISLAAHTGNVSVGTPTTVTLTDDDSAHLFFIKAGSSVEEGGQQSTIRVHMSKPHQDPVSVALSIGGTATADADYAALARSVTLSPGTENLYLTVSALTDGVTEGTETLDITLGAITGVGVTLDRDRIRHQVEIADGVGQLGQRQDAQSCASYLPSDGVTVAEVKTWRYENYYREHIERWNRVLAALGVYTGRTAMTAVEAAEIQARFNNSRWDRAARTLQALEDCANGVDNPPPPTPEISIAADGDITEGGVATFTISANPSPTEAITLNVSVTQSGDFGVTTGTRTVTIGTDGAGALSVATTDDATDEPDGSVTVTVDSGTGYTVSAVAGVATAAVADDEDPPPPSECTPELPSDAVTVTEVETWRDEYTHDEHVSRWNRVLAALGVDAGETPMTAEQAEATKQQYDNTRWDRTVRTLAALEQCAGST